MNKFFSLALLLVLAGAGCTPVQNQPTQNNGVQTEDVQDSEENESNQTQRGSQTQNTQRSEEITEETADNEEEYDYVYTERGVYIDDDSCRSFFANDHTDKELLRICVQYGSYANRMAKSIVEASPMGTEVYDKTAWIPEDPEGNSMVSTGQAASLAMLEAHKAWEKEEPAGNLVAKARSLTSEWFEKIVVFEKKWGVGP